MKQDKLHCTSHLRIEALLKKNYVIEVVICPRGCFTSSDRHRNATRRFQYGLQAHLNSEN